MLEMLLSTASALAIKALVFAPVMMADTGYQISRSLRFRSSNSSRLTRTYGASPTTRTKCHVHFWVKRGGLGVLQSILNGYDGTSGVSSWLVFDATDALHFYFGGASSADYVTTALYRDVGAWYCIDLAVDTTQASAPNRVTLWVNGVQVTSFTAANAPAQNALHQFAYGNANNAIGSLYNGTANYLDGYLADFHFIDGTPKTAADFGQFDSNGIWQPKAYAGSYGTNGFRLDFSDNSVAPNLGLDRSGNGNTWTVNNISVAAGSTNDSMFDSPTAYDPGAGAPVRGNYCTLNLVDRLASDGTLNDGGLTHVGATTAYALGFGTLGVSSGKWYYEVSKTATGASVDAMGIFNKDANAYYHVTDANPSQIVASTNGSNVTIHTTNWVNGDLFMCAFDIDAGKMWFGRNGTWYPATNGGTVGDPALGTNPTITIPAGAAYVARSMSYNTSSQKKFNFGQQGFFYTPPSGFKALCTQNMPTPAVGIPSLYFNTRYHLGNHAAQAVTGVGFAPDLTWIKARAATTSHGWFDTVRGAQKMLSSDSTAAEQTATTNFVFTSFDSDGYTLGGSTGSPDVINANAESYFGVDWKKGALPGVDIVGYTGNGANRTIAHSLGAVPKFMMVKDRSTAALWVNYHAELGPTKYIAFDANAAATLATVWNNTAPTSSVFSVGTASGVNQSPDTYIAYLFAEVPGFSKIGGYLGNNVANDGPFIWCGFRPRFFMLKRFDSTGDWLALDFARNPENPGSVGLFPNLPNVEANQAGGFDAVANGLKIRLNSGSVFNVLNGTYLYMIFADYPFKYGRAK